jgi:hypothetical protein
VVRLQMEMVQELPQKVASGSVKPHWKCLKKMTTSPGSDAGTLLPLDGQHLTSSFAGILCARHSSSILFSVTRRDPS